MSYHIVPEFRRNRYMEGVRVGVYSGDSAANPPRLPKPLAPQARRADPALRRRQTAPAAGASTVMGELLLAPHLVPLPTLRAATRVLDRVCWQLGLRREKIRLRWLAPPSRLAGFADCPQGHIYIRGDLPPEQIAVSVAHEVYHVYEWMNVQEPDEAAAERFGQAFRYWGSQPASI